MCPAHLALHHPFLESQLKGFFGLLAIKIRNRLEYPVELGKKLVVILPQFVETFVGEQDPFFCQLGTNGGNLLGENIPDALQILDDVDETVLP